MSTSAVRHRGHWRVNPSAGVSRVRYTTDVDLLLPHYGVPASRLGAAKAAPATTMLGVTRPALPGQMVGPEGTAVA